MSKKVIFEDSDKVKLDLIYNKNVCVFDRTENEHSTNVFGLYFVKKE